MFSQHVSFSNDVTHGRDNGLRQLHQERTSGFAHCLHHVSHEWTGQDAHFDKEENSTKPLKWNKLVLTSAFKLRVALAGRMARYLPNLPLSFTLKAGFTSLIVFAILANGIKNFYSWTFLVGRGQGPDRGSWIGLFGRE